MNCRRWVCLLLTVAIALSLAGCGSIYDKEYVVENDYIPSVQIPEDPGDKIAVHDFNGLKRALLALVSEGSAEGQLVFDSEYASDVAEDMASACWQVRTQDAMCAYCVENIAYELSKIVTHTEVKVTISYTEAGENADSIVHMQVAAGVDQLLRQALSDGRTKLALLIEHSSYTAETMGDLVIGVYRRNPELLPQAPGIRVNMLSGSGTQRLYEINLDYGMDEEELAARREELAEFDPFEADGLEGLDQVHLALAVYEYLASHCTTAPNGPGSVYSALIEGNTNSEGLALAFVVLCNRLGLDSQIIYGQKNGLNHSWNIVDVDGEHYHVDVDAYSEAWPEQGFLLNDEAAWLTYRWDVYSYPRCEGELLRDRLFPGPEMMIDTAAVPDETTQEQEPVPLPPQADEG